MIGRLLLGAVVSLAALVLFGAAIALSVRPPDTPPWVVTHTMTARRAMIVDVDARQVHEARTIAAAIVERAPGGRYDEILVYVRQRGAHDIPTRRIQWTRLGGYAELVIPK